MWNLFSTVEPKVLQPARSLKQQLLIQEIYNLEEIHEQSKAILSSINSTLKNISSDFILDDQNVSNQLSTSELQTSLVSLQEKLKKQNVIFEESITNRDQEKQNQQQFFKVMMKSYEMKKSELNNYIKELEEKVQKLQMMGLKIYSLAPDQDYVLSGLNQRYIDKYISKQEIINDAEKDIRDILHKNKDGFRNTLPYFSQGFSCQKYSKPYLVESTNLLSSLSSLQNHLQTILLNQEIIGTLITRKIKKRQKQFQNLASQQKTLKLGLSKLHQQTQKRNLHQSNALISVQQTQTQKSQSQKQKKKKTSQSGLEASNKLQVSFTDSIEQKISKRELQNLDQKIESEDEIPSENFLNACENLITKTFLEENQN